MTQKILKSTHNIPVRTAVAPFDAILLEVARIITLLFFAEHQLHCAAAAADAAA